jgi:hypothetical protein
MYEIDEQQFFKETLNHQFIQQNSEEKTINQTLI